MLGDAHRNPLDPRGRASRRFADYSVRTPLGFWHQIEAWPAPDLAQFVECYWEGWGEMPPLREKILPRVDVELMFNLQGRHRLLELDGRPLDSDHTVGWLSGLQRRYLLIETVEGSHFVAARLKPWGAWLLLREPMRSVSCRVPLLDEIWGDRVRRLVDRLAEAPDLWARFDLLEGFLRSELDRRVEHDLTVVQAARRLQHTDGRMPIQQLCRDLGLSRATLGRRFREQVGLTPKTYARVVRIGSLFQHLSDGGAADWARLASEFGYHDQAHLNRDFREFGGTTPSELLRRLAPGGGATIEDVPS